MRVDRRIVVSIFNFEEWINYLTENEFAETHIFAFDMPRVGVAKRVCLTRAYYLVEAVNFAINFENLFVFLLLLLTFFLLFSPFVN